VSNIPAFTARYGAALPVAGQYSGTLSDRSARVLLVGAFDETIFDFTYSSAWYAEANGGGRSLVNLDPKGPMDTKALSAAAHWRTSLRPLGSPGTEEPAAGLRMPGDIHGDGRVSISDIIGLLIHVFGVGGQFSCEAALNWNGDAVVNLSDAIYALDFLFQEGPPHVLGSACVSIEGCEDACVK
jgi:hypothetical protein